LSIEELILILKILKENLDILGVDITGDYSKISVKGKLKFIFSKIDHPMKVAADKYQEDAINSVNEETNLKILQALGI